VRQELGEFVRHRRKSLGLRREDVSARASVGYDWYVRIEQGRGQASRDVLQRVAEALKLDQPELEYVLSLAGQSPPVGPFAPLGAIPPSVLRVMHLQEPAPAYIINTRMDVLAWNEAACEFYGLEFGEVPAAERNVLWQMFLSPVFDERIVDCEQHANRLVTQCRAMWATRSSDPGFNSFIQRLSAASDRFREQWSAPLSEVLTLAPVRKVVTDPEYGQLVVEQTAWVFGDKSDHILILSVPLDEHDTAQKLDRLAGRRKARTTLQHGGVAPVPPE
jgi:transcriptional regulator with XRE-family HTH domain